MKFKKLWVAIMLVAFVVTGIIPASAGDTDQIDALTQQQQEINKNIQNTKKELNNTIMEQNKQMADLKNLNDTLNDVELTIASLNKEIDAAVVQIDATVVEIDNKQRDYDGRMMIFSNRLKEIYQYGDVDFLEVLLQSSDITDFLTRFEYLRYIADNDKQLLDEVTQIKTELEAEKADLEKQKSGLVSKRKNQEVKSQELQIATNEKEILLQEIEKEKENMYVMLDAFEEESGKIAGQIKRLQSTGGTAPSTSEFVWPCPSSRRVTSVYGPRTHPVKKTKSFHTGVDIGAGSGNAIVAAANGKVIVATYNSAYGNYIVVDHGGGLSTMYAHMSSFVSGVGDNVTAGQTIGKVGSTGLSTGPHLHFEVRVNGAHVSPNKYIGI